jgi:hypothetical protein
MNLPKSKTHSARSQYGLDITSVSSRRRSIFLDIPFYRTPLPEKSYKSERQEKYLHVGPMPILFCLGVQPNRLNVPRERRGVLRRSPASCRHTKR